MQFLTTEFEIGEWTGLDVPPVRVWDVAGMGVDLAALRERLAPTWGTLPWDMYDTRRARAELLISAYPHHADRLSRWARAYYVGESDLQAVGDLVADLGEADHQRLMTLAPVRRRSIASWQLHKSRRRGWTLELLPHRPFSQAGDYTGDLRELPRQFEATAPRVVDSIEYQTILTGIAGIVDGIRGGTLRTLGITVHQMGLYASTSEGSSNAPEGVHQDGCDYIVSALVIERRDVTGGESVVYVQHGDGRRQEILRHTLTPGQGLLQADIGTPLWHSVTPIRQATPPLDGIRHILGYDISVVA